MFVYPRALSRARCALKNLVSGIVSVCIMDKDLVFVNLYCHALLLRSSQHFPCTEQQTIRNLQALQKFRELSDAPRDNITDKLCILQQCEKVRGVNTNQKCIRFWQKNTLPEFAMNLGLELVEYYLKKE